MHLMKVISERSVSIVHRFLRHSLSLFLARRPLLVPASVGTSGGSRRGVLIYG